MFRRAARVWQTRQGVARRFFSQAPAVPATNRAGLVAVATAGAAAGAAAWWAVLQPMKDCAEAEAGAEGDDAETSNATDAIVTTSTGLMYLDTVRGAGELAKAGDSVLVHYEGKTNGFGDDDPVFDSSCVDCVLQGVCVPGYWGEGLGIIFFGSVCGVLLPD